MKGGRERRQRNSFMGVRMAGIRERRREGMGVERSREGKKRMEKEIERKMKGNRRGNKERQEFKKTQTKT